MLLKIDAAAVGKAEQDGGDDEGERESSDELAQATSAERHAQVKPPRVIIAFSGNTTSHVIASFQLLIASESA